MKKRIMILFVLAICLSIILIGCSQNADIKNKENNIVEDNKTNASQDSESINKIKNFIKTQEKYIKEKNKEKYIKTLSKEEKEYYHEKIHWFDDIISADITEYSLEVLKVEKIDYSKFKTHLLQKYHCNGRDYSLEYSNIYKIVDNEILDYDLDFKNVETEHFIVKYIGELELKDWICEEVEKGYNIVLKNYKEVPKERTIIKLYDDRELLRQSVKLSFGWQFAGWYEYPESIKFLEFENRTNSFSRGIAHELIHKITIGESANNLPYWLAEGLAEYFSKEVSVTDSYKPAFKLSQLEKIDLENFNGNISDYYMTSRYYVETIINKYGTDKVKEILKGLSSYGLEEKTSGEIYLESNKKFHEVVRKILNTSFEELDSSMN